LAELDDIMDMQQGDVGFRVYKQRNIVKADYSQVLQAQRQRSMIREQSAEYLERN